MAADISTLALEVDSTAVVRGRKDLDDLGAAGARSEGAVTKVTSAWRAFSGVMAALGLGLAIRELVQVADTMSLLDSRLKLATKSSAEFLAAQADIYRIAQQNNVGIEETTQLYVKLSKPIRDLGGSTKEVAGITDAFAKSLRVGGASAQEASAATLQFAQAMASGKLSGDEFRSLAEASPRFMQALADGLGVSTGALKEMSTEGKLTADVVGNALLKSLNALTQEAASMPDTVGGAFTRLANDAKVAIGELNKSSGMTLGIADAIESVRSLIPSIKQEIQGVVTTISDFFDRNKQSITEVWNAAVGLGSSLWEVAKAAGSIVGFFLEVRLQSGEVKTTIEAIRLVIAGVIDGVTFLGGVFATLGSLIMKGVTAPLQAVLTISANIAGLFDGELAAKIQGINSNIKDFVGAGAKYGDDVAQRFMNGETAVGRLNAELANTTVKTKSASSEVTKLAGAFGSLGGAGGAKDATPAKISEYEKLITSIKEKITLEEAELSRGRDLTKAEQLRIQATLDLAKAGRVLSEQEQKLLDLNISRYDSASKLNAANRESAKLYEQSLSSAIKENQTIQQQIEALKLQTDEIGKSEFALALLAESRLYDAAAQKEAMAAMADGEDLTGRLGELYRQQASALRDLAAAKLNFANVKDSNDQGIQSLRDATKQIEDFQSYIDKIDSSRLDGMFNGALKGIDKLITSVEAFGKLQSKTDGAKEAANKKLQSGQITQIQYEKELDGIKQDSWRANIALTQQSLSAIQSMTKEGSSAYKAMEVAQAALGATTALAVIANQGLGDPYTAIPRILAMAATMAQLGFAVNGLSGGSAPTSNQGTGTVFGDATAKSASIDNSLKILETSRIGLKYSAQMANSLKNIESAFAGVTNLVLRNGQIGNLESTIQTGRGSSGFSRAFGLGKKTTITASGVIAGPQSFGDILDDGFQGRYFADVQTKRRFRSTRTRTEYSELDDELSRQFTQIFDGMGDSVLSASRVFGLRTEDVSAQLSSYIVDIGKIDLKGLSGKEIQEKLSAVFGAEFDKIAQFVIPGLEVIQQVGEGYGETMVRAATQLESVNQTFGLFGGSLSLVQKKIDQAGVSFSLFGQDVDITLDRLNTADRGARDGRPGINQAITADELVQQFGGLEEFNTATQAFYEAFYTPMERATAGFGLLGDALDGIGLDLPTSTAAWRELTTSLDVTTEAGREAFETLVTLGPAFADLQNQLLDAAGISGTAIADVLRDGMLGRITQADIGAQLSSIVLDGIYNSLANGFAQQISNTFTSQIITPLLQSVATGGVLSASISQASIDAVVATATNAANQLAAILGDQGFQAAIAGVQAAINGIAGAFPGKAAQSYTSLGSAVNSASSAASKGADAWKSIGDSITNEIDRIRGVLTGGDKASALASFTTLTAQTRAGDLEAGKLLPSASQAYIKAVEESASSLLDIRRAQGFALSSLMETRSIIGQGPAVNSPTTFTPNFTPSYSTGGAAQNYDALIAEVKLLSAKVDRVVASSQTTAEVLDKAAKAGDGSGAFGVEVQ